MTGPLRAPFGFEPEEARKSLECLLAGASAS
jgi:hypothetical protein